MPLTSGDRVEVFDNTEGIWRLGRLESETDRLYMVLLDMPFLVGVSGRSVPITHLFARKHGEASIHKIPDTDPRIERVAEVLYDLVGAEREFEWRAKYGVPELESGAHIGICWPSFGQSDRRPFYLAAAEKLVGALSGGKP